MAYTFIFSEMREMFGVKVISLEDFISKKWANQIRGDDIAAIYMETLSNPFLVIPPLDEIKEVRDELCPAVPIVVDNTFLTPANFRPFSLLDPARDIALYSVTKYLAGHSDVMGGVVCGSLSKINRVWEKVSLYGCCLDAETAYFLERGLKTLHVRMERHNKNMVEVYPYLAGVSERFGIKMFHPLGGESPIPGFAKSLIERKQLGGMITFNLNGKGEKDGIRFMEVVHKAGVIKHATSLGGVESLISMPYNMSQSSWAQQEALGLKRFGCLLRLSVGIEDAKDIIESLDKALREICE
jgi:cystathionine beta-lyase/cystathionine gamma-synthase